MIDGREVDVPREKKGIEPAAAALFNGAVTGA
jgi:hypothetical protein